MKTTVAIADPLLERAREIALRDGKTLRSPTQKSSSKEPAVRSRKTEPFSLRDAAVGGDGLQPEATHLSAHELIYLSYEGRGG
jgi:hypothetical protein